jgi:hypothetical protein
MKATVEIPALVAEAYNIARNSVVSEFTQQEILARYDRAVESCPTLAGLDLSFHIKYAVRGEVKTLYRTVPIERLRSDDDILVSYIAPHFRGMVFEEALRELLCGGY